MYAPLDYENLKDDFTIDNEREKVTLHINLDHEQLDITADNELQKEISSYVSLGQEEVEDYVIGFVTFSETLKYDPEDDLTLAEFS